MGFDVKRAENIAYGFKEWIHKGQISYDNALKRIKATYREDMATEIIRILKKEIREVGEKCRWALVFSDVAEAEKAREKLSWRNIYPDSQEEEKLLWTDKEEAEYARDHVGGLIEPWGKPSLIPEKAKEEIAEAAEREYGKPERWLVLAKDPERRWILDWNEVRTEEEATRWESAFKRRFPGAKVTVTKVKPVEW